MEKAQRGVQRENLHILQDGCDETKCHFLMERTMFEGIWSHYKIILKDDNMHILFEDIINRTTSSIVKNHSRRLYMERIMGLA